MTQKPTVPSRKHRGFRLSSPSPQVKISDFQDNELCIQHGCPIQYLCFTCGQNTLCSQCILHSNHHQHQIKNIERAKQYFKNQLQEWNYRLQFKNNLLGICSDQFRENPAEIFRNAELYKEKMVELFEELTQKLEQQFTNICNKISQFVQNYKSDCQKQKERIRLRQLQISKMSEINHFKLKQGTVQQQAQYLSQKREYMQILLDQTEIDYYKGQQLESNWGLDSDVVTSLKNNIDKLQVNLNFPELQRDLKEKVKESLKKSVKKSKKNLRLPNQEKHNENNERRSSIPRNSHFGVISPFVSAFTPKNLSKQKKVKIKKAFGDGLLKKRKKSSAKIVSMPASPQKDGDQSMQLSPPKVNKDLFKKK